MTCLDYCHFLPVSRINYTLTYFADHDHTFSHDAINRYLRRERITARLMRDNVRDEIVTTPSAYLPFDDSVPDKDFSWPIALVRRPYRGNAQGLMPGLGVVTCV
ncbi:MAG: hypothetical protein PHG00_11955 [Methylococcales bacterium]|nr:hypothetical protein [Methylococcales bacterium]